MGHACSIYVDDVKVIGRSVEGADSESACGAVAVYGARVVPCGAQARTVYQRGQMMRQALLGDARQTRSRARAWTDGDAPARDGGRADEVSAGNELDAFVTASHGENFGIAASVDGTSTEGNESNERVTSQRPLTNEDWMPERVETWDNSREALMNAVELSFRRPDDCHVVMFPDASDLFLGCCLTQVPKEELVAGLSFMNLSHEPLAFLSGVFRRSHLCCPMVYKESFAILSDFQCVPYLLWDGSNIFCDHRFLAYGFSPQSCGVTLSKAASQRLAGWRACMNKFNYAIQHIPGEGNH